AARGRNTPPKRETRREAGTQSHGPYRISEAAGLPEVGMLQTAEEIDALSPNVAPPHVSMKAMARQLVPGLILPGAIYFLVSRQASLLVALARVAWVPA